MTMIMREARIVALGFTVLTFVAVTLGAPAADFVHSLPGQPAVAFKQYAGYVSVDQINNRNLFYYFVEAATNPQSRPLTLWLNGGPGCSSLGGGGFSELGPFFPNKSGQSLYRNPYAWNQESNIIFLESPAGVGFSYSDNQKDYMTNDAQTAQDSVRFLQGWLAKFPEYQNSVFFITGESYAGHYVPQLAAAVLKNNKVSGQIYIQVKGIMIGNPLLSPTIDLEYSPVEYAWSHGMVSQSTYDIIQKECTFSSSGSENTTCQDAIDDALSSQSLLTSGGYINPYNVLSDVCVPDITRQAYKLLQKHRRKKVDVDVCIQDEESRYLNLPEVQSSLHARPTKWALCSDVVHDNYDGLSFNAELIPVLSELVTSGLQVWVVSGDADGVIPVIGTRKIVNNLASNLNLTTSSYHVWFQGRQVGGWNTNWGNLRFVTVRGAGHMVPQTQGARGLQLFTSFLRGTPLPSSPTS